jgi:hypothetical protein
VEELVPAKQKGLLVAYELTAYEQRPLPEVLSPQTRRGSEGMHMGYLISTAFRMEQRHEFRS